MGDLISVAMATYNGEKYLKEQLDSIYKQNYKNIEVVVIDDASTDNTLAILQDFKDRFGLKYAINESNLGVTSSFEKALKKCAGEYILLADQDDVWHPNKITTLLEHIGDYSLIYSNASIIGPNEERLGISAKELNPLYSLDSDSKDLYKYIVLNSFILGCSTMFRRDLLSDFFPVYSTRRNHDWWLTFCASQKNGIKYLDMELFSYRHHKKNYSRSEVKITLLSKIQKFYSEERKISRRILMNEQAAISIHLINKEYYKTKEEKLFLETIYSLCNSFLNGKVRLKPVLLSIQLKKYLFPTQSKVDTMLHICSRLLP